MRNGSATNGQWTANPASCRTWSSGGRWKSTACSMRPWHSRNWPGSRCQRCSCLSRCASCAPVRRASTIKGNEAMETRIFGRSGLRLSILGFGCGAVGGLMVRGSAADQDKAIGLALDAGVNYFDTAVQYGNGVSETNLGRILGARKPAGVAVGTKVRVPSENFGAIAKTIADSMHGSLQRLQMDHVDIFHLHNPITLNGGGETLSVAQVRNEVVPAFEALRKAGKTRFLG